MMIWGGSRGGRNKCQMMFDNRYDIRWRPNWGSVGNIEQVEQNRTLAT